jgi:hypothetical protein
MLLAAHLCSGAAPGNSVCALALYAYVLIALLYRSHGSTVDLESKGAGVTKGVVKAWVHSL